MTASGRAGRRRGPHHAPRDAERLRRALVVPVLGAALVASCSPYHEPTGERTPRTVADATDAAGAADVGRTAGGTVVPRAGAGDVSDSVPGTPLPARVVPNDDWRADPPLGHAADALRRNLRPGESLTFHDVRMTVIETAIDPDRSARRDIVRLRLERGSTSDVLAVRAGSALRWNGYRVAVVGVYGPGELGAGFTALEVATLASLPAHVAASAEAGGADMRLRIPHAISRITLHHTGSPQPLRPGDDPVRGLRGLQAWGARDRNWWDVPYHFLIDLDGHVYEGRDWRYMGETNTDYDPAGHFLISVIGNYELQQPTAAQLDAIADMMAWAMLRFGVPADRIGGHYHFAGTSCPGRHLRGYLEDGTLQRMAQARLDARR